MSYKNYVTIKTASNLDWIFRFYQQHASDFQSWGYRGHGDSRWGLESSLERTLREARIPLSKGPEWEAHIYREFQRRCHQFAAPPARRDFVEWLALMQHHGSPTRLLDWTYSFWVALYFAIEKWDGKTKAAAVWILDLDWLREEVRPLAGSTVNTALRRDPKNPTAIAELFAPGRKFVWPLNAFRLNTRLTVQQGFFVAPGDLRAPFMSNLAAVADPTEARGHLIKLELPLDEKKVGTYLCELHRMNVTRSSLFPGLDGLAGDLRNRVFMEHRFAGFQHSPPWADALDKPLI